MNFSNSMLSSCMIFFSVLLTVSAEDFTSNCIDILKTSSGRISYKYFNFLEPNERCVWILRFPNATSYFVRVLNFGIPSSVIISGFGQRGGVNHAVPKPTIAEVHVDNSTVVVVTFHTGPSNDTRKSRGFFLWYNVTSVDHDKSASETSEDVIIPAGIGHQKYPFMGREMYGDNELSIFIITPVHRTGMTSEFRKTEVIYIQSGLDGVSCNDKLEVYAFDRSVNSTMKWKSQGPICGGTDSEVLGNNDLLLLIFQSDATLSNLGFHLYTRANVCEDI